MPTGLVLKEPVLGSCLPAMCSGTMGSTVRPAKGAYGYLRVKTTLSPSARTSLMAFSSLRLVLLVFASRIVSYVKTTSAEVSGLPSLTLTPSRRV